MIAEVYLHNPTQEEIDAIKDNPVFEDACIYSSFSPDNDEFDDCEYAPNQDLEYRLPVAAKAPSKTLMTRPVANTVPAQHSNVNVVKETPINLMNNSNIHEIVSEVARVVGEDMSWTPDGKREYKTAYERRSRSNDVIARAIGDKTARVVGDLMYDVAKSILDTSSMSDAFLSANTSELYRSLSAHK